MLQAIPTAPTPQRLRVKRRDPATAQAMQWLRAHEDEAGLGRITADFKQPEYAVLLRFLSWGLRYGALRDRRGQAADLDTDDASALEAAARSYLHRQVGRNRPLFELLLQLADEHHADFYPIYAFVAWALTAGRLKDAQPAS